MTDKIKILLAEDEMALGTIIKESLETRGFDVLFCTNGEQALNTYRTEKPELLVLDVMMPKKDGFTLVKEIRAENDKIPVIFLTSKSRTEDVVEGFGLGGNDYLKKPFSMEELIVRIHALLDRKRKRESSEEINIGKYRFNLSKQKLGLGEKEQTLTHREAQLLFYLSENRNAVTDRSLILTQLWGNDDFFNARSMDVFITKLRKKLSEDETVEILNIRGYGYKLVC
ncbi:response regulator transcription factor [Roseivirga seohaensis]|uniref:Transcriptional regulator n=2 Tax=Roseivirga seohaensis TaxID=1914963 RepID=A0A0L8AP71_9BACT|nr:response regulator transcription factor [Roseivirga seohaensis]KOF04124.1 transcriptional regulator [Roseivirga seohaensis subsp. aquiponti]KYG84133.1 two-component system response regulator [Roseivirga seohaensis]